MKQFLSAFGLILLAELGDKTQLMAVTLSAQSRKPLQVFLGGAVALTLLTFVGAFLGAGIAQLVPEHIIKKVAGVLFVVFGILIFFGKF